MRRWLAVVALIGLGACQPAHPAPPPVSPATSPTVAATPTAVAVRPPAEAILGDAEVGLSRTGGTDHLTAAQLAAAAPDQVLALQQVTSWGWLDGASRSWGTIGDVVVLTIRGDGARQAFSDWSAAADLAPLAGGPCPAAIAAGLDDCHYASGGGRAIVVGRLSVEVFRLEGPVAETTRLAPPQAARLRA
jgi:hypothetical protein